MLIKAFVVALLPLAIAACNTPKPDLAQQTTPAQTTPATPSKTQTAPGDRPRDEPQTPGASAREKATPAPSALPQANGKATANDPAQVDEKNKAGEKSKAGEKTKATGQNNAPAKTNSTPPEIAINSTVCGAGGQAAYFETKSQEIYICRSENQALTYIATPKKKGNSIFLPATAIQDGDKTAYIAEDGARTFTVGPVGYRLEEKGKTIAQEKVLRDR